MNSEWQLVDIFIHVFSFLNLFWFSLHVKRDNIHKVNKCWKQDIYFCWYEFTVKVNFYFGIDWCFSTQCFTQMITSFFFYHSSLNKSRLRTDLTVHIVLSVLMIIRVLPGLTSLLGVGPVSSLRKWNFPPPHPWEYAWMVGVMAVIVGWRSMAKNDSRLLKQYVVGSIVFGMLPVIYGLIDQSDDLYAYLNEKKYSGQFFGYPAVLVFYLFLFIAVQVHAFGIYFSYQLLRSWKPREKKAQ